MEGKPWADSTRPERNPGESRPRASRKSARPSGPKSRSRHPTGSCHRISRLLSNPWPVTVPRHRHRPVSVETAIMRVSPFPHSTGRANPVEDRPPRKLAHFTLRYIGVGTFPRGSVADVKLRGNCFPRPRQRHAQIKRSVRRAHKELTPAGDTPQTCGNRLGPALSGR